MEIVLSRKAAVAVRDQLVAQLELRILGGELRPGEKLPSVRTLARRLRLHHNTVSAAYQRLEAKGHVEMRPGAGVFVKRAHATTLEAARDLDEMIRVGLRAARRKGFSPSDIRAAVERWLSAAPPERVVAVDPSKAMAELLAAELRPAVSLGLEARSLSEVEQAPELLEGALAVSLPYHRTALQKLSPRAMVIDIPLEFPASVRKVFSTLPEGAMALVVSHSETVLPFARTVFHSLRGDSVLVETRTLRDGRGWRRLLPAVDAVFADELAAAVVRKAQARGLHPFRVLSESTLARVSRACATAAREEPRSQPSPATPRRPPSR